MPLSWDAPDARPETNGIDRNPSRKPPSLLLPPLSSFPLPSFLCWLSPAPPLSRSCAPSLFLLSYLPLLAASLFPPPSEESLLYSVTAPEELNIKKKLGDAVMQICISPCAVSWVWGKMQKSVGAVAIIIIFNAHLNAESVALTLPWGHPGYTHSHSLYCNYVRLKHPPNGTS